mmetsp:Transcript_29184/g.74162  ORF Transcript_29184/g.74162 Transcript_29184/m.74162 type:complete len:257 (+) Transcript_29184:570-1340(+)
MRRTATKRRLATDLTARSLLTFSNYLVERIRHLLTVLAPLGQIWKTLLLLREEALRDQSLGCDRLNDHLRTVEITLHLLNPRPACEVALHDESLPLPSRSHHDARTIFANRPLLADIDVEVDVAGGARSLLALDREAISIVLDDLLDHANAIVGAAGHLPHGPAHAGVQHQLLEVALDALERPPPAEVWRRGDVRAWIEILDAAAGARLGNLRGLGRGGRAGDVACGVFGEHALDVARLGILEHRFEEVAALARVA